MERDGDCGVLLVSVKGGPLWVQTLSCCLGLLPKPTARVGWVPPAHHCLPSQVWVQVASPAEPVVTLPMGAGAVLTTCHREMHLKLLLKGRKYGANVASLQLLQSKCGSLQAAI